MDNTPLAEHTWPPLTTVDLGSAERARLAAELLLKRIDAADAAPAERQRRAAARRPRLYGRRRSEHRHRRAAAIRPRAGGRSRAGVGLTGREALLLLIPALLPIVLLSVVPLVRGIYLGFTDSRAGLGVATDFIGIDNFRRAHPRRPVRQLVQDRR